MMKISKKYQTNIIIHGLEVEKSIKTSQRIFNENIWRHVF